MFITETEISKKKKKKEMYFTSNNKVATHTWLLYRGLRKGGGANPIFPPQLSFRSQCPVLILRNIPFQWPGTNVWPNPSPSDLKCYYDEKCCSRSLLILILYLAKMHHANYCGSISKTSLIFLTTISRLNCPPLPDSVPVELH